MAGRELRRPGRRQRERIAAAVDAAEDVTGLQLCVYVGEDAGETRSEAEARFVAAGFAERPAILVLVAPSAHHVEIVTAPAVTDRVPDEACERAIAAMVPHFAAGDLVAGVLAGIDVLVEAAGPGEPPPGDVELPDVL